MGSSVVVCLGNGRGMEGYGGQRIRFIRLRERGIGAIGGWRGRLVLELGEKVKSSLGR